MKIHEHFDELHCLDVRAVFLDIVKAFDKVWHCGLGFKNKMTFLLFKYYFHNRQGVVINSSTILQLNQGYPRASVLGPLYFLSI